ncbi:MAG: hypothetical protein Q8R20_00140 [Nanoarchaeota archaeon]|nr:hypothetical protein [Nanoarchaeota archaeon]
MAKQVAVPQTVIVSFTLVRQANDAEIRAALPAEHVFKDMNAFRTNLGEMIRRQAGGKNGDLLTNNANIFYVHEEGEIFLIYVVWFSKKWHVAVRRPNENLCNKGERIFSPSSSSK